jgi:hypothetical protein
MVVNYPHKNYWVWGFGGLHSFSMTKSIVNTMEYVNGSKILSKEMSSLYFWLQHWNHLRSVQLIFWDQSIHPRVEQVCRMLSQDFYL